MACMASVSFYIFGKELQGSHAEALSHSHNHLPYIAFITLVVPGSPLGLRPKMRIRSLLSLHHYASVTCLAVLLQVRALLSFRDRAFASVWSCQGLLEYMDTISRLT